MGHVRLGTLPKTREWRAVVQLISDGADVAQVADATFNAADKAFERMADDPLRGQSLVLTQDKQVVNSLKCHVSQGSIMRERFIMS